MASARARALAVITVGFLAATALSAGVGHARAYGITPPFGVPTTTGSFWLGYWQNLISTDPIDPSTLVFGDTIYVEFLNALGNRTITFSSEQQGQGLSTLWLNETYSVVAHGITVLTFALPTSVDERNATVCADGGCLTFSHASPITLIPSGVLTVGGLDVLAFGLTAEFGLLVFPLTVAARSITRKALWVPKFKAWLIAPHVALGFLLLVGLDYRDFDRLFSGLGFLTIPVVFALLYFLWVLHLFNVAVPVEVLRPDPQGGHALRYYRWRIFVGEMPDGRKVMIGTRWRDVFARLAGYAPTLVAPDVDGSKRGAPAESPVLTLRSETRDEKRDARAKQMRRFRRHPSRNDPLDSFRVVGAGGKALDPRDRDPPRFLYWVDSDNWLSTNMPHLSAHRFERVPEKRDPSSGQVVESAKTVRKLTWPHYVVPSAEASLAGIHYYDVVPAALGWVSAEKSYRRIETLRTQNFALKTTPFVLADESTEAVGDEVLSLLHRERMRLSPDEATEETRSEASKPSSAATRPTEAGDGAEPSGGRP